MQPIEAIAYLQLKIVSYDMQPFDFYILRHDLLDSPSIIPSNCCYTLHLLKAHEGITNLNIATPVAFIYGGFLKC